MSKQVLNFAAGPAALPREVLAKAQSELLDYAGSGISVMELSHRSKEFEGLLNRAIADVKTLLNVPDNYKILFLQGGGSTQFAQVALNLLGAKEGNSADYLVTGTWSLKAYEEAKRYGTINLAFPLPANKKYVTVPPQSEWKLNPAASYVYYCANETVDGVEFDFVPETNGVPLVCDMSSNILSRPVDVAKYGLIFAGAQKNVGPSGVTLVIIRSDLLDVKQHPATPIMLGYKLMAENNSLYNTPPTFAIYICGLVFEHLKALGGIAEMNARNDRKSQALYAAIDNSNGFFTSPVVPAYRSRMNVPFRIRGGDDALENKFLKEAEAQNMIQLKGHRSVGGIRASIYNAISEDNVTQLVAFMNKFLAANNA
ncbi:phosphoserine aminotransferase [Capsaspora owczarzaki ATCC 30864]|uniref:Phosphoserine aminotransferase n=1 Tax=Capsaspora owczarzaki (strain ATCC 30864) TaxID=595528 RepID=A0A0D2VPK1_CAPO3|nr:phosphoserine aminotransferase [Capsaspora owczarzaki ATCC 30864]KJE92422.1 phosphoserine aminotransferase [Capsaspora owczarzaki ATCC 30864]|eukprot:XP_004364238.1 phosphoserine aminotransferase [Capsaspora owczarzaki ATCC 30864]